MNRPRHTLHHLPVLSAALLAALVPSAHAQAGGGGESWQFGAVLDVAATSRPLALGARDHGLQLGHSDFTASGPLGRHLRAQVNAVLATHDGQVEKGIEEAWIETRTLPMGLSLRAGRFASQIGYLNPQHPHADDYAERPLLYRAFLGGHWTDDGVRLNLTLPTGLYWMVGVEAFRGRKLVPEADPDVGGAGAITLVTRLGGDLDRSNSWQLGLSLLRNRRIAAVEDHHDEAHEGEAHAGDEEGHEHHDHGAAYGGRRMWMVDATWKWAPDGNNREQQLRVTLETARISGINRYATAGERHDARALSVVWRFNPSWEVGGRLDRLRVAMPHEDHFHAGRLAERALMVAWKPSHLQALRLQVSRQSGAVGFEAPARRSVALQYVLAFGAHGAHAY